MNLELTTILPPTPYVAVGGCWLLGFACILVGLACFDFRRRRLGALLIVMGLVLIHGGLRILIWHRSAVIDSEYGEALNRTEVSRPYCGYGEKL